MGTQLVRKENNRAAPPGWVSRVRDGLEVGGSSHAFIYGLAFLVDGGCMVHFGNEAGKGDNWHRGASQQPWDLTTLPTLLTDL